MTSSPLSTISLRKRQAPASSGKRRAGRRFAYKPNALRIPRSPFSGRMAGSMVSHLGPPTEPKRTASAFLQASMVASGRGEPVVSMAMPPMRTFSVVNSWLNFFAVASSTRSASPTISGPIPSPAITTICFFIFFLYFSIAFKCLLRMSTK